MCVGSCDSTVGERGERSFPRVRRRIREGRLGDEKDQFAVSDKVPRIQLNMRKATLKQHLMNSWTFCFTKTMVHTSSCTAEDSLMTWCDTNIGR